MPNYDYRCQRCDGVFEVFQRISAAPGATCPSCASDETVRLISGGTFHLKGSGWYASDYQGKGRTGAHSAKEVAPASDAPVCGAGACGAPGCAAPAEA